MGVDFKCLTSESHIQIRRRPIGPAFPGVCATGPFEISSANGYHLKNKLRV